MPSRAQCVPTKTDRSLSCSRLRIADSHGLVTGSLGPLRIPLTRFP